MRKLSVAAIQATSKNGAVEENLDNAGHLVQRAAGKGAELVVCPEFLGAGYLYDERIWQSAEPLGGPTERWLARVSAECSVAVGAGFLEVEGDEFWNTFSLFGPDGSLLGRVRKASLPFAEGFYFQPCSKSKVLDTPFGRVAVGICNDTQTAGFLRHVIEEQPDLILMPHSAPTPRFRWIRPVARPIYEAQLRGTAGAYARALGVPVVMANKVSFRRETTPVPFVSGLRMTWRFHGYSSVWDGHGRPLGELVDVEDALVAAVTLDPDAKRRPLPPSGRGYFSFAPRLVDRVIGPALRALADRAHRSYLQNDRRTAAARAHAKRAGAPDREHRPVAP